MPINKDLGLPELEYLDDEIFKEKIDKIIQKKIVNNNKSEYILKSKLTNYLDRYSSITSILTSCSKSSFFILFGPLLERLILSAIKASANLLSLIKLFSCNLETILFCSSSFISSFYIYFFISFKLRILIKVYFKTLLYKL